MIHDVLVILGGMLVAIAAALGSVIGISKTTKAQVQISNSTSIFTRVNELESKWDEHQTIISRQALELSEVKTELKLAQHEVFDLTNEIKGYKDQCQILATKVDEQSQTINILTRDNATLRETNKELKATNRTYMQKLEALTEARADNM